MRGDKETGKKRCRRWKEERGRRKRGGG